MSDVPQIPLKEFFGLFEPRYVLGTTYTISLAFFEGLIFPEIKRTDLRRCMLLCDKLGFQRVTIESTALRSVGREYMAICAPAKHSFHPKFWLMVGDERIALLVGSGNLTQSGFMDNSELFDVVQVFAGGSDKSLVDDIRAFLRGLRSLWSGRESRRILAIETLDQIGQELERFASSMPEDPEPRFRLLSNFSSPIVEQFKEFFHGGIVQVAAPYFGGSIEGVRLLQNELSPKSIRVFPAIHSDEKVDVPISQLRSLNGVSVHTLKMSKKGCFAHLKVYGFDSDRGHWLFTTSANCTLAALGGNNVEAGLMRRTDRSTISEYFAEQPNSNLPVEQRRNDFQACRRWIHFWAVDRGGGIELIAQESEDFPLCNATVTIRLGGVTENQLVGSLFNNSTISRVNWDGFPNISDRIKHTALISISGKSVNGEDVHGDAIVDHPLFLTSDPAHRSAWRAALSLLEGEGLTESSSLASVFHLFQDVFDANDEQPRSGSELASSTRTRSDLLIPDKIPIWPPISDADWHGHTSGHLNDLQWFQKILTEFINPHGENNVSASPTSTDSMDDEASIDAKLRRVPAKVVKSIWKQASGSFEQMRNRLSRLEVNRNSARKIWAVATAVLLATLLTRRQLMRHGEDIEGIPSVAELIREFLRTLFIDRPQPSGFTAPDASRYSFATFPSIAEDLHDEFNLSPSSDIAGVLALMFAYWNIVESRAGMQIPAIAWLLFRDIAPSAANTQDLDCGSLEIVFSKFFGDEAVVISWPDILSSLEQLAATEWKGFDGFKQLDAIIQRGLGKHHGGKFPPTLEQVWGKTVRRIQSKMDWHYPVDALTDVCVADGCNGQFVTDPLKCHDLRRLFPTICRTCGAVLTPIRLWRAYEEYCE